jgi:LL-diaminopimelate aminotransferase
MKINQNYLNLKDSYLFSTIAKKIRAYQAANPDKTIIKMGIGDVTQPLCKAAVKGLKTGSSEQGVKETFHGYGDEQGCGFLQTAIKDYYADKGVQLNENEIFISDGAKSDLGNILDIFSTDNVVLITSPVYPVYVDTNIMAGREIKILSATQENGFVPLPDKKIDCDIIYLCSPNNPTGAVYSKAQLKKWVDYAKEKNAVILFDSAYEAFVSSKKLPTSIYQIDGAKDCAIEFCSLSKTAGFTGTRCGYTVVPTSLVYEGVSLNKLWLRRQTTKFNGVSYVVQKGAAEVFTKAGRSQFRATIKYYMENAKIISETLTEIGVWHVGGQNSPYIWMKCKDGYSSWEFFDLLLDKINVAGTPGEGFGSEVEC